MLKAEQIPDEVVKAALEAWKKDTETFHPNAGTIAAAINAWPGMSTGPNIYGRQDAVMHLPLPKEASDE